ncbi:MAG: LanC-like protein [Rubrivivax sp.]
MHELLDPARHEPLSAAPWDEARAREAIARIGTAAESEFDEREGGWLLHPQDDPPQPGNRSFNLYWGATGVVWALRDLAARGAFALKRDYRPWIERYPERVRAEAAGEAHGNASYLFGESAALLLAWAATGRAAAADRLHAVVQGNLHNPVHEPLWGNGGTALAAIHMAEATREARWTELVREAVNALRDDMVRDPDIGTWLWQQDLYGRRARYLGAGHGLAGNAYAALRGAAMADATAVQAIEQRTGETLAATALHAPPGAADDSVELINWHVLVDPARVADGRARGGRPLVQDCHGAPGIACRLAGAPRSAAWDRLLRGAGELTWFAGPLAKGPSLCHGSAGSALACLKLWRRFGEPQWLERARRLALHAAEQVEQARERHGQGRHSLWTGDLGVACVLWNCITGDDRFPTLDHF